MSITPWSEIADIFALDGAAQESAVNRFLADPHHQAFFRKVADNLCRRYAIRRELWFDDVHALVQQVAWVIMVDPVQYKWATAYSSWAQAMSLGSQNKVREFVESAAYLGTSGASTRARRRRMLMVVQSTMQASGIEPSAQAVVDAHNQAMRESRSDPARQGVLATVDDLTPLGTMPLEMFDDPTLTMPATGSDSDCPLMTTDAVDMIRKVLSRSSQVSDTMGLVAKAVYGNALAEPPFIATVREAAIASGLSVETVRRNLREVDSLMREILADEYGVTAANA